MLKYSSNILLLFRFLSLRKHFKTRKNVFFISLSKFYSFLSYLKFSFHKVLKCLSFMKCHEMPKKYVLLNNLGSIHGLLIKFSHVMSYIAKERFLSKNVQKCGLDTGYTPFCVYKRLSTDSAGKSNY